MWPLFLDDSSVINGGACSLAAALNPDNVTRLDVQLVDGRISAQHLWQLFRTDLVLLQQGFLLRVAQLAVLWYQTMFADVCHGKERAGRDLNPRPLDILA